MDCLTWFCFFVVAHLAFRFRDPINRNPEVRRISLLVANLAAKVNVKAVCCCAAFSYDHTESTVQELY
jgi:hypothetical protein